MSLGGLAAAGGRPRGPRRRALDLYRQALAAFEAIGDRAEEARILDEMAWTYLAERGSARRRRYFFDSVQAYTDVASVRGVGLSLIGLAAAEAVERGPRRAVQIAAAAEVYAQQEGIVNVYSDETPGREFVDRARAALLGRRGRPRHRGGRRLTIKEALDLARMARSGRGVDRVRWSQDRHDRRLECRLGRLAWRGTPETSAGVATSRRFTRRRVGVFISPSFAFRQDGSCCDGRAFSVITGRPTRRAPEALRGRRRAAHLFGSSSGGTPVIALKRHRPTTPVPTKGPTDGGEDSDASAGEASAGCDTGEVSGGEPRTQATEATLQATIMPILTPSNTVYTADVCGILARSSASLIVSLRPTSVARATSSAESAARARSTNSRPGVSSE